MSVVEPMYRGVMTDGGIKILTTKEYLVPTVYDNGRLVSPLVLASDVGFQAFEMKNVKIELGPTWVENRLCSGLPSRERRVTDNTRLPQNVCA